MYTLFCAWVACVLVLIAILLTNSLTREHFTDTPAVTSVMAPSWNLAAAFDAAGPGKEEDFSKHLAAELADVFTCAFFDFMHHPDRFKQPDEQSEEQWLRLQWNKSKGDLGISGFAFVDLLENVILPVAARSTVVKYTDVNKALHSPENIDVMAAEILRIKKIGRAGSFPLKASWYKAAMECKDNRKLSDLVNLDLGHLFSP